MIYAKVIADSISEYGVRLTTLEVRFNRFILPEFNTHRVFSRNFSSSRAIPTGRLIAKVRDNPAMPIYWGKNQAGMQAAEELDYDSKKVVEGYWRLAASKAADFAEVMADKGAHKQIVNRVLEPYLPVRVLITATDWNNFFALRCHPDAQPEIRLLADLIRAEKSASVPVSLEEGEWHLPYVSDEEIAEYGGRRDYDGVLRKVSAARAARNSYKTHDGRISSVDEDLALCERLTPVGQPAHSSPFEHAGSPDRPYFVYSDGAVDWCNRSKHGNFNGFIQARKLMPNECVRG